MAKGMTCRPSEDSSKVASKTEVSGSLSITTVIALLKGQEFDFALQFINYR